MGLGISHCPLGQISSGAGAGRGALAGFGNFRGESWEHGKSTAPRREQPGGYAPWVHLRTSAVFGGTLLPQAPAPPNMPLLRGLGRTLDVDCGRDAARSRACAWEASSAKNQSELEDIFKNPINLFLHILRPHAPRGAVPNTPGKLPCDTCHAGSPPTSPKFPLGTMRALVRSLPANG